MNPELPKLWRYNLHYHDYLWVLPLEDGAALALDWIRMNPAERDACGWEPYPVSLRLQNWCMYFFGKHSVQVRADTDLATELWQSILDQSHWLESNVEWHILGNHIVENAAALTLVGATFEGPEGDKILEVGLRLLNSQLPQIVLDDGGHAERTPMYHARLCMLLENLQRTEHPQVVAAVAPFLKIVRIALGSMVHPDGQYALLNDSALGIYPDVRSLGIKPEVGGFALKESGYYGSHTESGHYLICDVGELGLSYQPGHAHGDIFSFELSLEGQRLLVDSGVYNYIDDEWRRYARSTRAHNTVEINRLDQSEFWSAFRVGRRAKPHGVTHSPTSAGFSLEGHHSGYRHLHGSPVHHRMFRWHDDGVMLVRDTVPSSKPCWIRSYLHLHPEVSLDQVSDNVVRITRNDVRATITFAGPGRLSVEKGWYFPEFGLRTENDVLAFSLRGSSVKTGFCIALGRDLPEFSLEHGASLNGVGYGW